ncbi:histidine kinase [Ferruginibacter paludis]|uniref:sensor histidine kinase n=1 Tax=Ferruginibacter paludis TaxID=1310417 RepID=UPI0025B5F25E|nr:histidine kinase [Ferruginibacter paludis]MDN3658073.1 histidine kinase [Ferruginibacter paludis]
MARNTSSQKKSVLVFFITFLSWFGIWSTLQVNVLLDFGIPVSRAITDSVISNLLLEAFCLLIINNMRYYLPKKEKYWYTLIISFGLSSLWLLLLRIILWRVFKNDTAYLTMLGHTSLIRFAIAFLIIGCCTVLSLLWYSQQDQQADSERKQAMERLAREAELNKLRQQLQPHFLFNSLNSISALTGSQPEKARHMIQQLSDFLRGTLKKEQQQWTSFEEELQYLQLYLDIEKVRFGYRLQTQIETEPAALQMHLPSMLLQPLVENAIKFGLYDTIGEVTIFIRAKKVNDLLEVSVQNPFDETTSAPVKGTGFGLSSIRRRLFLLFARHDLLQIKKEAQQFITTISIPQQNESNHN